VTLLPRTTAFGAYADRFFGLAERVTDHLAAPDPRLSRERLWQVRARQVVLAAGAIERPLVFPDNDRPGIMLADAARTYATRDRVLPGRHAVVVTACDSAYGAALDLHAAGVTVGLIADIRPTPAGPLVEAARAAGLRCEAGMTVLGTSGRRRVRSVRLSSGIAGPARDVACDLLCVSGGWTPSLHLYSQARGRPRFAAELGAFLPGDPLPGQACAGACRGLAGLGETIADGIAAGAAAAAAAGFAPAPAAIPEVTGAPAATGWHLGALPQPPGARGRAFVDLQNDVTAKDLVLAAREGFRAIEHVKRYTTTGMATDQGKTSNLNALAIVADHIGRTLPEVGLTTFRAPYTPVTFGTLAGAARGALFDPVRTTPMHRRAAAAGAVFAVFPAPRRGPARGDGA
jgi:sarcosine oxidase subunit alpha